MRFRRLFPLLFAVAAWFPVHAAPAQDPAKKDGGKEAAFDESILDEKILRDARLPVDGPALLKYFRDRTYKEQDPKRLALLVEQLGDKSFTVREKAHAELLTIGATALAVLKEALNNSDEEVRKRAADVRLQIEERADPSVQGATARLIGHRRPDGAAEVLLDYLPFAADDTVIDDLCRSLGKVAMQGGKVDAHVLAAVKDKLAIKRGAAGAALVLAGTKEHLAAAHALLTDPVAEVRLRVALALVASRDKSAVPVLIESFKEMPADKTWPAEELLLRIAGTNAPQVSLGNDDPAREKCHAAWMAWWKEHGNAIDLAKVDFSNTSLGYTVIVYQSQPPAGKGGRVGSWVVELDAAKNVRWKFEVPNFCMDAVVIGPDRVLIVERNNQRISIRDFKGEIKWEKAVGGNVLSAQRLQNGGTMVVTQNTLVEFDATGKEVFHYQRQTFDIYRGRKMRNGDYVIVTTQGAVMRFDAKQRDILSFNVGFLGNLYGSLEELANGNLLLPLYQQNKVVEFDTKGKEVWSVALQLPTSAQRLANGNTLISSQVQRKVVEVDRNGREVWSFMADGQVFAARRR